jgi:hypothetical protein
MNNCYKHQINKKNKILSYIVQNLNLKEKRDIYKRLRTSQKNYNHIYNSNPNLLIPKFGITIGEFSLFIELNSPSKHPKNNKFNK